jgi:subtilase family serine protease
MSVVVLSRWAGVLAAAAGLTVAGLAATPATASAHPAASAHAAASGPSAAPRFVAAHHAARLPSGFTQVCPQPSAPGVMQCSIVVHSVASVQPANRPASGTLSPGQLRSAYGLSQAAQAPNKDTIAIVDAYNDWHAAADLAQYRSYYGLGACTTSSKCLRVVNQKGTTAWYPKGNSGWAEEESLDLDMVSAICPHCKILLVESNTTTAGSLSAAEATAVRLGAKFISNSWGAREFSTETSYDSAFEHSGVAVTVAAGDYGFASGSQWPAVSPDVTSVGGTTLWMKGRTRTEEKVWNLGTSDGTGSGCSQGLETQQSWQAAYSSSCAYRVDNDVAADADPRTGPAVYDSYAPAGSGLPRGWQQLGGTSASSPIIAAVYALASPDGAPAAASRPTQFPYQATSGVRDITIGSNGSCGTYLCTAEAGYDGPTGLGVPSGVNAFR